MLLKFDQLVSLRFYTNTQFKQLILNYQLDDRELRNDTNCACPSQK